MAFQSTGETVIWDFSRGATEKILFDILKYNENIPFGVGFFTGFCCTIKYKNLKKNAVSKHKSFIGSATQLTFIQHYNQEYGSECDVIENIGIPSTSINTNLTWHVVFSTYEFMCTFSTYMYCCFSMYQQPRFLAALQITDSFYTAGEWLLIYMSNELKLLAPHDCTEKFLEFSSKIDLVLPKKEALYVPLQELQVIKTVYQSILNFFPYNKLKMPNNTDLVLYKLVFLLKDNRKETLNDAIKFFSESFFCNTAVNFKGSKDQVIPGTENETVNVVICEFTGSYKLSFSNVFSNKILFKILQANEIHLEKNKDLLLEIKTLNLPFHLGKITRLDLKITCF